MNPGRGTGESIGLACGLVATSSLRRCSDSRISPSASIRSGSSIARATASSASIPSRQDPEPIQAGGSPAPRSQRRGALGHELRRRHGDADRDRRASASPHRRRRSTSARPGGHRRRRGRASGSRTSSVAAMSRIDPDSGDVVATIGSATSRSGSRPARARMGDGTRARRRGELESPDRERPRRAVTCARARHRRAV